MKKNILGFIFLLLMPLLFIQCKSSDKLLESGQYKKAFDRAYKALKKRPLDEYQKEVLKTALTNWNRQDSLRIHTLKNINTGDSWVEVYLITKDFSERKQKVQSLSNTNIDYTFENYHRQERKALEKALRLLYEEGEAWMKKEDKLSYRKAYQAFYKVKNLQPTYKEVGKQIDKAIDLGTTYVYLKMNNRTGRHFDSRIMDYIEKRYVNKLDDDWTKYSFTQPDRIDGEIELYLENIHIGMLTEDKNVHRFSKEVIEYEYVKDARGNVVKDKNGNDVKKEIKKTKSAKVAFIKSFQPVKLSGFIIFRGQKNREFGREQIDMRDEFSYYSYTIQGDEDVLDAKTKKRINEIRQKKRTDFESYMESLYIEYFDILLREVKAGTSYYTM